MIYRKKPVEVKAAQFDGTKDSIEKVFLIFGNESKFHNIYVYRDCLYVGSQKAKLGDWIVREDGRTYVVKSDKFEINFERVVDERQREY